MQVCLITAQVKSGAGVRSEWWSTDRSMTLPPLPGRRVPHRSINTGEGGRAPWRLMQDRDTGKASRKPPSEAPVTTAGQKTREAKADTGTRAAMVDQEPWVAMVDTGTRAAMADQEPRVDTGIRAAMTDQEPRVAMAVLSFGKV